ncbi:hypothetical protein GCM10007275_02810 [Jeotgalicoccus coquinae]|uniref:ATPase n=1 Tax=Jeotgalicoccus coquinae TaxID=709509 RepID=A0ABR6QN55_9STAP|nr:DUF3696 domain-containing protein [Jeotgalicoccus coquinae]MBB6423054.1 putative ATPase [Jeotgalicoccus coquinae]GGE11055.1 hypothetical protein GCM10007275_02810 [Jeotgalicoccus coquinae]
MLTKITVKNFKSFDESTLELSDFNLITGMNSAGKSTLIQALLLSIQNISNEGKDYLNGHLISLGMFSDIRNFLKNAKNISIKLYDEEDEYIELYFEEIDGYVALEINNNSTNLFEYLNQKNKKIRYLSSKRIGFQDIYSTNYDNFNDIGIFGEYAIDFYENNKTFPIEKDLVRDKTIGTTLELQLGFWLKYIMNSRLSTENISGTDYIKAEFAHGNNRLVRPKNIGSGLSYIISILVSGLTSKKGDLNIIENPEIHLHPKAQSRLTEFLTFISDKGIRYIIETHSDHIFNGMRKAINKDIINTKSLNTYFFSLDNKTSCTYTKKIEFDDRGNVLNHIPGLFDQFDDDLDELLGLK